MSEASNTPTEHLAWLLGCLDSAVECLDWCGRDVDARIVEAHRAQLAAGREWPGEPVECPPEFHDACGCEKCHPEIHLVPVLR